MYQAAEWIGVHLHIDQRLDRHLKADKWQDYALRTCRVGSKSAIFRPAGAASSVAWLASAPPVPCKWDGRWRVPAGSRSPRHLARATDPVYMSRKIRKFRTDKFDTWNKRKFWLMWLGFQPLCMSYTSQNFRLFQVSNLSVLNFRICLLMYPGCLTEISLTEYSRRTLTSSTGHLTN